MENARLYLNLINKTFNEYKRQMPQVPQSRRKSKLFFQMIKSISNAFKFIECLNTYF